MDRLLTPLLRKIYGLFGVFILVYFACLGFQYSSFNKERLYRQLLNGTEKERASAGFDLAYLKGEIQLVRALQSQSSPVRLVAISSLWDLWVRAGGHQAFMRIQEANRAIARKSYPEALDILSQVTKEYPRFPEGWNRRATLYWELGRYEESVADARKVVLLNPNHFGAWQGLGLCHAQLGDLEEACRCLRSALRIIPHDPALQRLLGRCEEVLHLLQPRRRVHRDLV